MPLPYALIIEPNDSLHIPYAYLEDAYEYDRCSSIEKGLAFMAKKYPDILFLSASFSLSKSLKVLESLKQKSSYTLIPLVIVVDLSNRVSSVPGTSWGNKIGLVSSLSSAQEVNSTLDRVMNA
jgi:hypothetical protein